MKKIIIYLLLLLVYISSIYLVYYFSSNNKIVAIANNTDEKISEIDDLHKYKIRVYYPVSEYKKLNNHVKKIIYDYIMEFKGLLKDKDVWKNSYYTLDINYDEYTYRSYLSYVFYIETDLGGAHPDHVLITINYDTDKDKIIDINTLLQIDNNILDKLSIKVRDILLKDDKFISNNYVKDMFDEGTVASIDNYKNFVLTENGIKILFGYYQIAPYYFGITEIIVPYEKLNISI